MPSGQTAKNKLLRELGLCTKCERNPREWRNLCLECRRKSKRETWRKHHQKTDRNWDAINAARRDNLCSKCLTNPRIWRHSWCKVCLDEKRKAWSATERAGDVMRRGQIRSKFGSGADLLVDSLLSEQDDKCAICGRGPESQPLQSTYYRKKYKALAIDHDHKTDKIRGLLCENHNRGLGLFEDNPSMLRKAAEYLERFK